MKILNKASYLYMPNQKVKFIYGEHQGTGIICGQATSYMAIPLGGTQWIVKIDQPISGYLYDCIVVLSIFLEPLESM